MTSVVNGRQFSFNFDLIFFSVKVTNFHAFIRQPMFVRVLSYNQIWNTIDDDWFGLNSPKNNEAFENDNRSIELKNGSAMNAL